jgi:hypothetical protein
MSPDANSAAVRATSGSQFGAMQVRVNPDFSYWVGFRAAVTHPTAEPIKRVVVAA